MKNKTKKTPFEILCICIFALLILAVLIGVVGIRIAWWISLVNRSSYESATYEETVDTFSEYEDIVIIPPEIFGKSHWCNYKILNRKSGAKPAGYIIDLYYVEDNDDGLFQIMAEPNAFAVFDTPAKRIEQKLDKLKKECNAIIYKDGYTYSFYFYNGEFEKAENELKNAMDYVLE